MYVHLFEEPLTEVGVVQSAFIASSLYFLCTILGLGSVGCKNNRRERVAYYSDIYLNLLVTEVYLLLLSKHMNKARK